MPPLNFLSVVDSYWVDSTSEEVFDGSNQARKNVHIRGGFSNNRRSGGFQRRELGKRTKKVSIVSFVV